MSWPGQAPPSPLADDEAPEIASITRLLGTLRCSPTPILNPCKAGAVREHPSWMASVSLPSA